MNLGGVRFCGRRDTPETRRGILVAFVLALTSCILFRSLRRRAPMVNRRAPVRCREAPWTEGQKPCQSCAGQVRSPPPRRSPLIWSSLRPPPDFGSKKSDPPSGFESTVVQIPLLFLRHGSVEDRVAMRKSAKPTDDVVVVPGVRHGRFAKRVQSATARSWIG